MKRPRGIETTDMHKAALRMAWRCRRVVQGCLREEEWADADTEFHAIIMKGLRKLLKNNQKKVARGLPVSAF